VIAAKRQKPLDRTGKVTVGKAVIGVWEDRTRPRPINLNDVRLAEVERVIRSRHETEIPATDDADLYFKAAALSLSERFDGLWIQSWAPWVDYEWEIQPIVELSAMRKHMQSADDCAAMLCVTMEERTRLGLTTIGACDVDKRTRKRLAQERKRERDRMSAERRRRAQGQKPRDDYEEASLAAQAPWQREGVSRATWYRKKKQAKTTRETSPSRAVYISGSDAPVSSSEQVEREARTQGVRGQDPDGEWGSAPPQKVQANAR